MIRTMLSCLAMTLGLSGPSVAAGVVLTVEGLRNDRGQVLIFVFDNARAFDAFDVGWAVDIAAVPARRGQIRHDFPELTKGPYAIFLFHDENGDEDLNMTASHLLEGIGASGAPGRRDDPSFAAAAVWPGAVRVRVHYDK